MVIITTTIIITINKNKEYAQLLPWWMKHRVLGGRRIGRARSRRAGEARKEFSPAAGSARIHHSQPLNIEKIKMLFIFTNNNWTWLGAQTHLANDCEDCIWGQQYFLLPRVEGQVSD